MKRVAISIFLFGGMCFAENATGFHSALTNLFWAESPHRLGIVRDLVHVASRLTAEVQTEVPPAVAGAKPVAVEHIKVHGAALEGNLEGDSVDRDVFVFLPPSYSKDKRRRYPVVYALHGY